MKLWFIRHAESEANAGIKTSHPRSISITPTGIKQSQSISLSFEERPDVIITSSFIRTKQTAKPTIDRFPDVQVLEWEEVKEFTYLSPLICQNTTVFDRKGMVDDYWNKSDPYYVHGKGAESFFQFLNRVERFRSKLNLLSKDFIVVFSHMQFIAAFMWILNTKRHVGLDRKQMSEFKEYLDRNKLGNGEKLEIN